MNDTHSPRNPVKKLSWLSSMAVAFKQMMFKASLSSTPFVSEKRVQDKFIKGAKKFNQDSMRTRKRKAKDARLTELCIQENLRRHNLKREKDGLKPVDHIPAGHPGTLIH